MIRFRVILALVFVAVLLSDIARSAIRVNGNQLVEGAGTYGSPRAKQSGSNPAPSRLVYTIGMGVMARGSLPDSIRALGGNISNAIGIGLGFDVAHVVYDAFCLIDLTGDIDLDGKINSQDLILLVAYTFRSAEPPWLCPASGDVNCSGNVTSADCMYLINYVFKSGPEPCDVCTLIPAVWPCP